MSIPYILTANSLSFVIGNKSYVIPSTHQNWDRLVEAFAEGSDADVIQPLVEINEAVVEFMNGEIQVRDRRLYYQGRELNNHLTRRILQHLDADKPGLADPLIALLAKTLENPSYRAVEGLYEWLEKSKLPITPDGEILAYKIVNENYFDIHTGTFDHRPGKIVSQPRNQCDENPDNTCSAGLHFCSMEYLPEYGNGPGSRVVIVKIHPRDVVAFPRDYNISKGRCCRMEVVSEVDREFAANFFGDKLVTSVDEVKPEVAVGQIWQLRNGEEVIIDRRDEDKTYPWFSECGMCFTEEGRYLGIDREHQYDLVKFLGYDD